MENIRDWKQQARQSLLNNALKYITPAQDVRDLELRGYHAVARLGYIMEAKKEQVLAYLHSYKGNFEEIKQITIQKIRKFLKPRIK